MLPVEYIPAAQTAGCFSPSGIGCGLKPGQPYRVRGIDQRLRPVVGIMELPFRRIISLPPPARRGFQIVDVDAALPHHDIPHVEALTVGAGNPLIDHHPGMKLLNAHRCGPRGVYSADPRPAHGQVQPLEVSPPKLEPSPGKGLRVLQAGDEPVRLHFHGPLDQDRPAHCDLSSLFRSTHWLPCKDSHAQERPTAQPTSTSLGKWTPT